MDFGSSTEEKIHQMENIQLKHKKQNVGKGHRVLHDKCGLSILLSTKLVSNPGKGNAYTWTVSNAGPSNLKRPSGEVCKINVRRMHDCQFL